ncbi:MAG TPA: TM2 domain-containing protein [Candidatus Krumholzibacteria bacterium]|nr:TM2 domain-containing protein [Candidatus Krumholzibacteria bacterium]
MKVTMRKEDLSRRELLRFELESREGLPTPEVTWMLWVFFSAFGAHRFHLGDAKHGAAILLGTVGAVVWGIVALIESTRTGVGAGSLAGAFVLFVVSVVWSWVDALFINRRLRSIRWKREEQTLKAIGADRGHIRNSVRRQG